MKKIITSFLLAGTLLLGNNAQALLLDHGPSDPTLLWPSWYRDPNGLALGICKSTSAFCFPPTPVATSFAGNVGSEIFYNMVEFRSIATGSDFKFRYLAALEASYLPVGVPVHGTENVFARVRIALNFNDINKNGTYVVTHPFGTETFYNVQASDTKGLFGANSAVFFTIDVGATALGFEGALGGAIGPFIQWDSELDTLVSGTERFVGAPTIPHTFTGSPYGTNFLRIQGPVGSNLDGLGNDFIETTLGTVLGQVWTAPIAQPLSINSVFKTRSPSTNGLDVFASSSANQNLILSGAGIPSLQLFPNSISGGYHGHVEFAGDMPSQVTVTNTTSIPSLSVTSAILDSIDIKQATFNTNNREVTITAKSSDEVTPITLSVEGVPGVPNALAVPAVTSVLSHQQCPVPVVDPTYSCFVYVLPANIEPPEYISIVSTQHAVHAQHLLTIVGVSQSSPINVTPTAVNIPAPGFTVNLTGTTTLPAGLPVDAIIIKQPANGVLSLVAGQWVFKPSAAVIGIDSFQFVRQSAPNAPISNLATGALTLAFTPSAPNAVADQFAATYAGVAPAKTRTVFILQNDSPASADPSDVINPASVNIVTAPTKGNVVRLPSGAITYTTKTATAVSGGTDFFTYTVNNSSTPAVPSNPARVDITNFSAVEAVSITKPLYTVASGKWTIVGATTWVGPNLTQASATCWTGIGATPISSTLIGSALIDITGKFQFALAKGPVAATNSRITCQSSHGGKAAAIVTAK